MARLNLEQTKEFELDALVPKFAEIKSQADAYKKESEEINTSIKNLLKAKNKDSYTSGGYTVKMNTSVRETLNEDKLLKVIHENCYSIPDVCAGIALDDPTLGIIKTREYIDTDALEDAIYKGIISQDVLLKMNECKEVKEVTTLRVSKEKKQKEDTDNE